MMQNTVNLIKQFFENKKWKYDFVEEKTAFVTSVNMNSIVGVLRIYIFVKEKNYRVYTVLNSNAEESAYARVAEYLHRVNYGTIMGNFEFDYRSGEIRYKTYVNIDGTTPSLDVIEDSILFPLFMFEKYGKNLFRAMLSDESAELLVQDAEKKKVDDSNE